MISSQSPPSTTVDITFLRTAPHRLQAWMQSISGARRVGEGPSHEAAIANALGMPRLQFESCRDELDAIRAGERNHTLILQVRAHHQMRCLGTR